MKFITDSKHGQEMLIVAGLLILVAAFLSLKHYKSRLYLPGQNACIADCSRADGGFRRYIHNMLSADQCICELDDGIGNIWN